MTNAPNYTSTGTLTTDPLGNTVFCFGYCFLQQMPSASSTYPSAFTINPALTLTSTNLVGVAVAVASLDQQSRQLVNQAQLVAMANALLPVPRRPKPANLLDLANQQRRLRHGRQSRRRPPLRRQAPSTSTSGFSTSTTETLPTSRFETRRLLAAA